MGDAISKKLDQINKVLSEPVGPEFRTLKMLLCGIGVEYYPEHGKDADTLLTQSDSEMYRMKRYRTLES